MRRASVLLLTFLLTLAARVWGIGDSFLLMRDQIRDWEIALRPFSELPLLGPATHVGGYTIGPAFYWMLWGIRVSVGPWFDYLPHAGGIGQAILHSAADVLLLMAVWKRTSSVWVALLVVAVTASAPFDLSFSGLVWNPVAGATLAKTATALVLLEWHRARAWRAVALAGLAWSAVHAYTGAIFVTVGVFAALVFDPLARGERRLAGRNALLGAVMVGLLQIPWAIDQVQHRFERPAMGAVTHSVARIVSGEEKPHIEKSLRAYVAAVEYIEASPRTVPYIGWILLVCGISVAVRYRRDVGVLSIVVLPQLLALAGYALFLAELDSYYYLPLMPTAVLAIALGIFPWMPPRARQVVAGLLLITVVALFPERFRASRAMNRMPEYGVLVRASRSIAARHEPMRAIRTDFPLPFTADPQVIYRILGGRIDRRAPWLAIISADGRVTYRKLDQP